jgi:low temperature requirement protein LtrA
MRPPRPHGEAIEGRTVSFLELFYDLVFVVFVSQVATRWRLTPTVRAFAASSSSSLCSGTRG